MLGHRHTAPPKYVPSLKALQQAFGCLRVKEDRPDKEDDRQKR
jgi:hypothetical protein